MLGDGAVALGPDSALRLREVRSLAPKIRVACSLLDGVSKYQEGETMTGIGPRAVGIVDLEPTTQRVISDLAHDAAARPDVLHHELYNVADSGPGIPETDLPRLFERFYRVDKARSRSTRDPGGTGLGLAIVKHLIGLHGGTVAVANRPEGGAVFTIELPA